MPTIQVINVHQSSMYSSPNWKQLKSPSAGERIHKLKHIHTIKCIQLCKEISNSISES
jgi:hypothetical protein